MGETRGSFPLLKGIDLTDEQVAKFTTLKSKLSIPDDAPFDGVQDDITLYRFLRAKKWVLEDAMAQYQAMIKWRKQIDIPGVYKWAEENKDKCDLIQSLYPHGIYGEDKKGRPLIYDGLGGLPGQRFSKLVTIEEFRLYHIHFMEELTRRLREMTKKEGRAMFQITAIVDMGGMNMSHRHFIPYFKSISKIDEQCYPELINTINCVNAPWAFPVLFKIVRGFIDPTTRQKIRVYSSEYEETLREIVDEKVLNHRFGGKNPMDLPTVKALKLKSPADELATQEIASKDAFEFVQHCNDKKGGRYEWCFSEESTSNVCFKIEWKGEKDKKYKTVLDGRHATEHKGKFAVKGKGALKLIFDNSKMDQPKSVTFGLVLHSAELLKTNAQIEARRKKEADAKRKKDADRRKKKESPEKNKAAA